jgi:hypothetical protein
MAMGYIYPRFGFMLVLCQEKIGNPGVDVMITIFCDFRQFFRKKIGVFLKNQCYDQNFAYFTFVLSQKRQFFAEFFGENILKSYNIGPWSSPEIRSWST